MTARAKAARPTNAKSKNRKAAQATRAQALRGLVSVLSLSSHHAAQVAACQAITLTAGAEYGLSKAP